MEVSARGMRADDLDEVHDRFDQVHRAATGRGWPTTRERLDDYFDHPYIRPALDLLVVEDAGAAVGWVIGIPEPPYHECEYEVAVDQELGATDLGLADAVVATVVTAAHASAAARPGDVGDRLVVMSQPQGERTVTPRLAAEGFGHLRTLWEMEIELPADVPEPEPPEGVRFQVFDAVADHDDMLAVVTEAFLDDPSGPPPPETFDYAVALPNRVVEVTLLARDDQGPLGAVWAFQRGEDVGYLSTVGVVPRARGRGIATALLRQSFHGFAARGVSRVTLDVDSRSSTGATRVYERAGMHVVAATELWAAPLRLS